MKNPLQTLLIVFALGLCGLCTWQWYGQMLQQKRINTLAQSNYDQSVAIQGYVSSAKKMNDQIAEMDARLTELRDTVNINSDVISKLRADNGRLTSSVEQYSKAAVELEGRLKEADDTIRRQNEGLKSLAQERDEYADRLNQSIKEHNEIVTKYNALVKQIEATQKERNDIVMQYNTLVKQLEALQKERNDIVAQYNALAKQFEAAQAAQSSK
jgi:chromosome segregation ATPase